jgi:hypothetical protein
MSDIEISKSKRENPIVYPDGFVYRQHRMTHENVDVSGFVKKKNNVWDEMSGYAVSGTK